MDRVERDEVLLLARRALLNGQDALANLLFSVAGNEWGYGGLVSDRERIKQGVDLANKLGIGI